MNLFLTSVADGIRTIDALKMLINGRTKLVILPFAHDFKWLASAEDVYEKYDRCHRNTQSIFWKTVKPFIDIGIDPNNIVVINKKIGTLNGKVISQAQVFVEVGKDVKEYILDEDQYERLMKYINV